MIEKKTPKPKEIVQLFYEGKACSAIDKAYGLRKGYSHDVMISHWYSDNMKHARRH